MKKLTVITALIFLCFIAKAQVVFKTIVPIQPIVVGESFPVQYVLEDIEKNDEFTPPPFNGFQLVSGPYTYSGSINTLNGSIPSKNILYTLIATKPGRYIIAGATAKVNGKYIKSDDAIVQVISKTEAVDRGIREEKGEQISEYFLRAGEDPHEKIQKNLFMRVMVDKKNCYVGEPVVATFKLYSRLESRSDIIKNPGFYGFAVQDMINLNDRLITSEIVNGKPFDVHTIRTVQLYPLQAGIFTIDAMEVLNRVEFSKSFVNRKTEQQIEEGVTKAEDLPPLNDNTVTYENTIRTEEIKINVKSYPELKKPASFDGATGNFSIRAECKKNELAKNEEGFLIITLSGKGNFAQLPAPAIQWPAGIEVFEPVIKDSLDKTQAPLKGSKAFHFPFIASRAGTYNIPAIVFTFFDPGTKTYRTINAEAPGINVTNQVKETINIADTANTATARRNKIGWIAGIVVAAMAVIIAWLIQKKKKEVKEVDSPEDKPAAISIEELLRPVQFAQKADDRHFYDLLQKTIWSYLSTRLNLSGSKINKSALSQAMCENQFGEDQCRNILDILQQCEAAMFTKAEFADDKQQLFDKTKSVLEKINI